MRSPPVAQWVEDPVLSLQWLWSLCGTSLIPGWETTTCHAHSQKKKVNEWINTLLDNNYSERSWWRVSEAPDSVYSSVNCLVLFFFFFFHFFRATPMAFGNSDARGWTGATAAGLCHSHSNMGSEPHLQPTPQPMAMPDPWLTEQGRGLNPHPHGYQLDLFPLHHNRNSLHIILYTVHICCIHPLYSLCFPVEKKISKDQHHSIWYCCGYAGKGKIKNIAFFWLARN